MEAPVTIPMDLLSVAVHQNGLVPLAKKVSQLAKMILLLTPRLLLSARMDTSSLPEAEFNYGKKKIWLSPLLIRMEASISICRNLFISVAAHQNRLDPLTKKVS